MMWVTESEFLLLSERHCRICATPCLSSLVIEFTAFFPGILMLNNNDLLVAVGIEVWFYIPALFLTVENTNTTKKVQTISPSPGWEFYITPCPKLFRFFLMFVVSPFPLHQCLLFNPTLMSLNTCACILNPVQKFQLMSLLKTPSY